MKFCNKCVIPETAETNTFNSSGTCSVCTQIERKSEINWHDKEKELDKLIEN